MSERDTTVVSMNRLQRPESGLREETVEEAIVHPFFPGDDSYLGKGAKQYDQLFEDLFIRGQVIIHGLAWLVRNNPVYLQSGAAQNVAEHVLKQYCTLDWGIAAPRSKYGDLIKIISIDESLKLLGNPILAKRHIRRKAWWTRPNGESPRATLVSKFLDELAFHDHEEDYSSWASFLSMLETSGKEYKHIQFVQFFASSVLFYETVLAHNHPPHSIFR